MPRNGTRKRVLTELEQMAEPALMLLALEDSSDDDVFDFPLINGPKLVGNLNPAPGQIPIPFFNDSDSETEGEEIFTLLAAFHQSVVEKRPRKNTPRSAERTPRKKMPRSADGSDLIASGDDVDLAVHCKVLSKFDRGMESTEPPPGRTEREKMLAGELYNSADPELVQLRWASRRLQRKFNQTVEEEEELRQSILQGWLGAKAEDVFVEPPFTCDYGWNVFIGEGTVFNFDCVILDTCRVAIGANVKVGPKVQIYTATHPTDVTIRSVPPFLELGKPIKIGNKVWLGGGCIICPGVTIGDNSTVGAGAVVTRSVPANVVVAGNPARIVKELPLPPWEKAASKDSARSA